VRYRDYYHRYGIRHDGIWRQIWKHLRIPSWILVGISIAFLVFIALAVKAPAQELYCRWRTYCNTGDNDTWAAIVGRSCVRRRVCTYGYRYGLYAGRFQHQHLYRGEEDYRRRDPRPDADDGKRCKWSHWIREVGNDKLSEQDARVSAQDRWSQAAEARLGTLYSDVEKAEELMTTCVKKVPTTATQGVGAALGLRHFVCEVEGVPCAPAREDREPTKRRIERLNDKIDRRGDEQEKRDRDDARRR
jgi:hypothetical protein